MPNTVSEPFVSRSPSERHRGGIAVVLFNHGAQFVAPASPSRLFGSGGSVLVKGSSRVLSMLDTGLGA
jgi:hypothetical protein